MLLPGGADTGPDPVLHHDPPRSRATSRLRQEIDAGPPPDGTQLFLDYLPIIDAVTANMCRHHRLRADDREEFSSYVRLALLERDAEVLRQYTGTGTAVAFLRVVIGRLLFDFRCERWGRWRPSATARRHGQIGILLDRLLNRDGLGIDEAVEIAHTNYGVPIHPLDLWKLCQSLSLRPVRYRPVPEDEARDVASSDQPPDLVLLDRERTGHRTRLLDAVAQARSRLSGQEQLILKMRLDDGLPVSRIALALHLDQKRLYKTLAHLLAEIREALRAQGISSEDVDECLENPA
jgi:RNA polymerase sigma factor (sigma-70 family)